MTDSDAKHYIDWFDKKGQYYFVDENGDTLTRKDCEDFLKSNRYDPFYHEFIFNTQFLS